MVKELPRDYTDGDLRSAKKKLEANMRPGAFTYLTSRELAAAVSDLAHRMDDFILSQVKW